jgi:hypothetical protein
MALRLQRDALADLGDHQVREPHQVPVVDADPRRGEGGLAPGSRSPRSPGIPRPARPLAPPHAGHPSGRSTASMTSYPGRLKTTLAASSNAPLTPALSSAAFTPVR